jgi:hypothetical protein
MLQKASENKKKFQNEWQLAFLEFNMLLISPYMQPEFVTLIPKHVSSATYSNIPLPVLMLQKI